MPMLDGILFSKTILTREQVLDGEYPLRIAVTDETNGYLVWLDQYDGQGFIKHINYRDEAIEFAVKFGDRLIYEIEKAGAKVVSDCRPAWLFSFKGVVYPLDIGINPDAELGGQNGA